MRALVDAALAGTARQPDRARTALTGESPVDALVAEIGASPGELRDSSTSLGMTGTATASESKRPVIPSERRLRSVIPSERSLGPVTPSERSESRNRDRPSTDATSLERRLLLAAAVHDAYARAGCLPRTGADAVPPAAAEIAPHCAPSVTTLLADLLAIRPRVLLAEALERMRVAGSIVAPGLIPELLDTRDPLLAALLPHVIGERGRWLVALTGGGDWLLDDAPDPAEARRIWEEGPFPRRLVALRAQRRADPGAARDWVAASWAAESAEHRAQILGVVGETLHADDAAFLEQTLGDRGASVRAAAARLLARLPDSDAAQRFTARAVTMLAYEAPSVGGIRARLQKAVGMSSAGTLAVQPPVRWDAAWERDGIAAKPPKGTGERAHWLTESLALVAPERWTRRFGADPRTLIRAALDSDWALPVLLGWSQAAMNVRDEAWAAALWDAWLDDAKSGGASPRIESSARGSAMMALHRVMSAADAEERALALMRRTPTELPIGLVVLVHVVPAPWSSDYSRRFLAELAPLLDSAAAASQWAPGTWFESLEPVAMRLAPPAIHDALALERNFSSADTLPPAYRRKLDEFRDAVRLRQRIHEEIPGESARR
jgi:hypothetical protein